MVRECFDYEVDVDFPDLFSRFEELVKRQVFRIEEEHGGRREPVAAGPAELLVIRI